MNKLNQTGQNSGTYFPVQQNITLPRVSLPKKTYFVKYFMKLNIM